MEEAAEWCDARICRETHDGREWSYDTCVEAFKAGYAKSESKIKDIKELSADIDYNVGEFLCPDLDKDLIKLIDLIGEL